MQWAIVSELTVDPQLRTSVYSTTKLSQAGRSPGRLLAEHLSGKAKAFKRLTPAMEAGRITRVPLPRSAASCDKRGAAAVADQENGAIRFEYIGGAQPQAGMLHAY